MDTQKVFRAINNLPSQARERVLARIQELVMDALAGDENAGTRNGRAGGKASRAGRKPRMGKGTEEQVLAYIKSNPDQRTEQIAKALGSDVKPALKKLRVSKLIRTKGQKRAMTYSASARA